MKTLIEYIQLMSSQMPTDMRRAYGQGAIDLLHKTGQISSAEGVEMYCILVHPYM